MRLGRAPSVPCPAPCSTLHSPLPVQVSPTSSSWSQLCCPHAPGRAVAQRGSSLALAAPRRLQRQMGPEPGRSGFCPLEAGPSRSPAPRPPCRPAGPSRHHRPSPSVQRATSSRRAHRLGLSAVTQPERACWWEARIREGQRGSGGASLSLPSPSAHLLRRWGRGRVRG